MDCSKVKVILFDLDGTLYQDTVFHRDYIQTLVDNTPYQAWKDQLVTFTDEILMGKHLEMNSFYEEKIVEFSTFDEYIVRIKELLVPDVSFEEYYQGSIAGLCYLGDAWSVVTLIAISLGLREERGNYAFLSIREKMMKENLAQNNELIQTVSALKERYTTILLSNSPQQTAFDFVKKLGFQDAFTHMSFESGKPIALQKKILEYVPEICHDFNCLLSIGDHALNEIINVQMIGGQTIWMSPYLGIREPQYDVKLRTLDELAIFLKKNLIQ